MAIKVSRRGGIAPFIVMDVMASANERQDAGHDVIHLEVGQPATGAPAKVVEVAARILVTDQLGYTEALGLVPLRRRITEHYRESYGLTLDPGSIAVTTGSSGAFISAFLAAFDAGDRIAFAVPGYPGYCNIVRALDLEPVPIATGPDDGFQLSVSALERLEAPPDGLILASPANPTGTMIAASRLAEIVAWCRDSGVRLVADEIYHGITYGARAETLAAMEPTAIVINSFSKYFSMTGWRLGWMVVPQDLLRTVECLAQNLFISPPTLAQHAAAAVFDCRAELDANVARYADNRRILLDGLPDCGFGPLAPADGAFYVYAGISALGNDSVALAREMLEHADVAVTPGTDFDPERGDRYVRFSYAGATGHMTEAVHRLGDWAKSR
jgi:aspartate/methionine/tyrosine aminotransferase